MGILWRLLAPKSVKNAAADGPQGSAPGADGRKGALA
jgi:hypothetical protein